MSMRLIDEHPELVRVGKQDMPKGMKRDSMHTKLDYCFFILRYSFGGFKN